MPGMWDWGEQETLAWTTVNLCPRMNNTRLCSELLSLLYWAMLAANTIGPGTVVTCARQRLVQSSKREREIDNMLLMPALCIDIIKTQLISYLWLSLWYNKILSVHGNHPFVSAIKTQRKARNASWQHLSVCEVDWPTLTWGRGRSSSSSWSGSSCSPPCWPSPCRRAPSDWPSPPASPWASVSGRSPPTLSLVGSAARYWALIG